MIMLSRVRGGHPTSVSAISADESNNTICMLYSDQRDVVRQYEMTLTSRVWKLERRSPGFSQRFIARFSADHRTITVAWEKSADGYRWEHDFSVIYRSSKPTPRARQR